MRYRKINNKGSVLREPFSTAVHIKRKIGAVRFYVRFSSADIFLRLLHERLNLTHFVYKMYRVVFAVF